MTPSPLLMLLLYVIMSASLIPTTNSTPLPTFLESSIDMTDYALPTTREMPVLFLSHAAPVLIMKENEGMFGKTNEAHFHSDVANWYRGLPKQLNLTGDNKPLAIVQFSAHFETNTPTIKITAQDEYKGGLLYDYYGFPAHTYDVKYPCPGNAKLAKLISTMLNQNGFKTQLDFERGIDHGGFIPLLLMYPEADIPVIQISIANNAREQRLIAETLAPLRKSGILFTGSGQATHGAFRPTAKDISEQKLFVESLTKGLFGNEVNQWQSVENVPNPLLSNDQVYEKRSRTVDTWAALPGARSAHPHFDHYMPLPACVGLTKGSSAQQMNVVGDHWLVGIHSLRSFVFGEYPFTSMKETNTIAVKDVDSQPVINKDEL